MGCGESYIRAVTRQEGNYELSATWESESERLRSKFVAELLELKKVPIDVYPVRIPEVVNQQPFITYFLGKTFGTMVKARASGIGSLNAQVPFPSLQYQGALRAYTHPKGGTRSLPAVPEFIFNPASASTLADLFDFELLRANIMFAFPKTGLKPSNAPNFENGTYVFHQPQTIGIADEVAWSPPLPSFASALATLRNFTFQEAQSWTICQSILSVAGVNKTFNVILAPSKIGYKVKTANDADYDDQVIYFNGSMIRIYAEMPCVVFLFNRRYRMNPTVLEKQWVLIQPNDGGLTWFHIGTETS